MSRYRDRMRREKERLRDPRRRYQGTISNKDSILSRGFSLGPLTDPDPGESQDTVKLTTRHGSEFYDDPDETDDTMHLRGMTPRDGEAMPYSIDNSERIEDRAERVDIDPELMSSYLSDIDDIDI